MGFWFAESPSWTTDPPPLRVEFFEIADLEKTIRHVDEPARLSSFACRTIRRPKKTAPPRARSRELPLPLLLEIDSNVARIGVDPDTWADLGETVLFAVAQYWRLEAIDRALDELSAWRETTSSGTPVSRASSSRGGRTSCEPVGRRLRR